MRSMRALHLPRCAWHHLRRKSTEATSKGPKGGLEGSRYFTKTQEWFQVESDGTGTIGITQVAQRSLGEIVYCRLPEQGTRFKVMETICTLEAVKTCGEVHSPVAGEVLEVNTRLELQPCLVTHAPLTDGWLVRLAFDGKIPRLIEPLLADMEGLQSFLQEKLLEKGEDTLEELTFANLRAIERSYVHKAAQELGLFTASYGTGAGRQLLLRRRPFKTHDDDNDEEGDDDETPEPPEVVQPPEPLQRRSPRVRRPRVRLLQR